MSKLELAADSEVVTVSSNDAGHFDEIFSISPRTGTRLSLSKNPTVFSELRDADGDLLPGDTQILLTVETPTSDKSEPIAPKVNSIYERQQYTIREQQSEEYRDNFDLHMDQRVTIEDDEIIHIEVYSDVVVDWDNSRLFVPEENVDELNA